MLAGGFAPGLFHQQLPHGFGRRGKEVSAAIPARILLAHQPQVGIVHQSRGLQGVARGQLGHAGDRQSPKLLVQKGQKLGGGFLVAIGHGLE